VLDLSKIEAGQLVLELSDYCIQDIAQTVRSTLEPLAADKKLGFKVEVGPQLPSGHGDGRRLTQVLINLVGNAIKFTDAGEVAIKAEAQNGSFHVSVRDTGPGISSADQTKLFQEFQQADNAITRKKGGTGLGLAISKRIIEMHGGRIWVESQPGQGSTFTFTLPVIVERQGGSGMSKRILVVEDQPDSRQIIRDMVAGTDYEITEAENGEEALAAIAKQRPDLILMDIQLPIMDGYTATRLIKTDPALRSIPIIAVTSYALAVEEKKARAAGCDDYVTKPFSPRQLLAKIRQYMQ
jgi:CheY-like chemotaxis protein/two-component sensor histidine kinase